MFLDVIITTAVQIVQHLLTHMSEDAHATRQFHAKNVLQMLLSLFMIFIINRQNYKAGKFKVCSRLYFPITVET